MDGQLERAAEIVNARKRAVGVKDTEGKLGDDDFARLCFSGLDLDLAEIDHYRREAIRAGVESITRSVSRGDPNPEAIATALAGMWVDGLMTGVHVGREQEKSDG